MIASAAPVAGAAEALGVAQVVAAHVDAEAPEHLRAEQLDLVVAARRDDERLALPEHREAEARPGRHAAREERRLGVLEGAQQRLGLCGDGRVPASVGRAAARRALERRRAIERGGEAARRVVDEAADEQRVGLHGPKHSTRRALVGAARRDRLRRDRPRGRRRPRARRTAAAGPRARDPPARCARGTRSASRRRRGWSRSGRAARRPRSASRSARRRARRPARRPRRPASGAVRARDRGARGGPGSAPRARRDAPRGAARARRRSRPGEAGARAACAGRAAAATRGRARARRRSCGASSTRRSRRAASRVVTTPASTSEWPGEVLRGALPGEVGAEVERALQERRRERAVAAQQRASGMRVGGGPRDVREREQRVGRRLDDRERGAVAGAAEARRVARVVAAQLDAEALQDPGRESLEAVVAARRQRQGAALSAAP